MRVSGCRCPPEGKTTDPPSRANVRVRAEKPSSVRMKIGDKQRSPISIKGPGDHFSLTPQVNYPTIARLSISICLYSISESNFFFMIFSSSVKLAMDNMEGI